MAGRGSRSRASPITPRGTSIPPTRAIPKAPSPACRRAPPGCSSRTSRARRGARREPDTTCSSRDTPTAASSGPGTSSCGCSSRSPPGSTAWAACGSTSTAGPATGDRPCASGSPRRSRSSAWWRRTTESSALAGRRFVPAGDLAAPCAGRAAPAFDELLEVLHRLLHVVRHDAEGVAHLFDDGLRLVLHREANPGPVDADGLEAHLARVRRAGGAAPRDDAVGLLPRDLRVPLLLLPGDRGAPVQVRGIELAH